MKISDKERLDWIEERGANVRPGGFKAWQVCTAYVGWMENKRTLRQAIDAALRAERKAKRGRAKRG